MTEQKARIPILKVGVNLPAKEVVFEFDTGKEIGEHQATKKDGTTFLSKVQYYYTLMYQGVKHGFYANSYANNRLVELKPKGKTISLCKVQGEDATFPSWVITEVTTVAKQPVGAQQPQPTVAQVQQKKEPF